jgi:hypothetical protein
VMELSPSYELQGCAEVSRRFHTRRSLRCLSVSGLSLRLNRALSELEVRLRPLRRLL